MSAIHINIVSMFVCVVMSEAGDKVAACVRTARAHRLRIVLLFGDIDNKKDTLKNNVIGIYIFRKIINNNNYTS